MDQAISHESISQTDLARAGRRSGWSEAENRLLWETADEAQQQGLPLKSVFDQIARQTGRRPNSIRNYYYAQVRQHENGQPHAARFVPFTQQEVDWLMEQVLTARAEGQSVRACLQKLSEGDHSLMLRYQNKYRAVIKSRPDYVREMVEKLNDKGVECDTPQVNHRARADINDSSEALASEARRTGDAELARGLRRAGPVPAGQRAAARRPPSPRAAQRDRTHQGICGPERAGPGRRPPTTSAPTSPSASARWRRGSARRRRNNRPIQQEQSQRTAVLRDKSSCPVAPVLTVSFPFYYTTGAHR